MYSTSPLSLVDMSLPLSLQPSSAYRSKMATRQFPKEILCACSLRICLVSLVTTSISFIYFSVSVSVSVLFGEMETGL